MLLFSVAIVSLLFGNIEGENNNCSDIYEYTVQYQADLLEGKVKVCIKPLNITGILQSLTTFPKIPEKCIYKPKPWDITSKIISKLLDAVSSFITTKEWDLAGSILRVGGDVLGLVLGSTPDLDPTCEKQNLIRKTFEVIDETLDKTLAEVKQLYNQLAYFSNDFIRVLKSEFNRINDKLDLIIERIDTSNNLSLELSKISNLEADISIITKKFKLYLKAPDLNAADYVSTCLDAKLGIKLHDLYESVTGKEVNQLRTLTTSRFNLPEYLAISAGAGLSFTRGATTWLKCIQIMGIDSPDAFGRLLNDAELNAGYLKGIQRVVSEETNRIMENYWPACVEDVNFFIATYQGSIAQLPNVLAKHLRHKFSFREFTVVAGGTGTLHGFPRTNPPRTRNTDIIFDVFNFNGKSAWIIVVSTRTGVYSKKNIIQINQDFIRCFRKLHEEQLKNGTWATHYTRNLRDLAMPCTSISGFVIFRETEMFFNSDSNYVTHSAWRGLGKVIHSYVIGAVYNN